MNHIALGSALAALSMAGLAGAPLASEPQVSFGDRPYYLIDRMAEGPLRQKLASCAGQEPRRTAFSIGHRGAALMYPEHTVQSYTAAARQGAGIIECDVTFTADKQLVCRHAQNDLATTTNMVTTGLAAKCTQPFAPASGGAEASAECRTSDITLAEFRTLAPKMDAYNADAASPDEFLSGTASFRTELYVSDAEVATHAESIALIDRLGADFTPELKAPSVEMPFEGFTRQGYAQAMIDEYRAAGIDPSRVWPQSFDLDDIRYWIEHEPEFGAQAVYLDDRYEAWDDDEGEIDPMDAETFRPTMQELAEMGVRYIAPPMWMLVTLDDAGAMVPSVYAREAKDAGLGIITWTLERSGPLKTGGGWYFQSVTDAIDSDGDYYEILDVLAQDVGVAGVFSDWPATVTYYANCMGL